MSTPIYKKPHPPRISQLLNGQDEFWRSPGLGKSGFVVEQVNKRAESLHGGPVTIIWSEGYRRGESRPTSERRDAERTKEAAMRRFLESEGYAMFVGPAGHLVVLTPQGAQETKAAGARADQLLGSAPRFLAATTLRWDEDSPGQARHIGRERARSELILAMRYEEPDTASDSGRAVVTVEAGNKRTEYIPQGPTTGRGPYLVQLRWGDGASISRHETLTDAQQAGDTVARQWIPHGPTAWEAARTVLGGQGWAHVLGVDCHSHAVPTGVEVHAPARAERAPRPVVVEAPHDLVVDGETLRQDLPHHRVSTNVRNAYGRGLDMEQQEDGSVRIEDRWYVPRRPFDAHGVPGPVAEHHRHQSEGLERTAAVETTATIMRMAEIPEISIGGDGDGIRLYPVRGDVRAVRADDGDISRDPEVKVAQGTPEATERQNLTAALEHRQRRECDEDGCE